MGSTETFSMKLLAISSLALAAAKVTDECVKCRETVHESDKGHLAICPSPTLDPEDDANRADPRKQFVDCFSQGTFSEEDVVEACANESSDERSVTSAIMQSSSTRNLRSYGCWCNIATDWQVGRGEPVDGLDTACRNVHHSYKCLTAEGCDKNIGWITGPELVEGMWQWTCAINKEQAFDPVEGDCAVKACTVGTHLYSAISNLYLGGESINPANVHIGTDFEQMSFMGDVVGTVPGEFNFDNECVALPGDRDVKCCGPYPFRREYDINSAECCLESGFEKIRSCGQCFVDDLVYASVC